jgi:hypothetical protein
MATTSTSYIKQNCHKIISLSKFSLHNIFVEPQCLLLFYENKMGNPLYQHPQTLNSSASLFYSCGHSVSVYSGDWILYRGQWPSSFPNDSIMTCLMSTGTFFLCCFYVNQSRIIWDAVKRLHDCASNLIHGTTGHVFSIGSPGLCWYSVPY